jgi:hypothetical protein
VFLIERLTTDLQGKLLRGRKSTVERAVGVTSLTTEKADPGRLLALNRGHWQIENSVHYVRDVTYDEDRSQVRRGNRPQAMASLRNVAISLLRLAGSKNIAASNRELARKPHAVATLVGL